MDPEIFNGLGKAGASTGERVRSLRRSKMMTQKEFAASLGIVQGFLCAIEKGRKTPSDTLMIALQHLYGVNSEWLLHGHGEMFANSSVTSAGGQEAGSIPLFNLPPSSLGEILHKKPDEYIKLPDAPAGSFAFICDGDFMSPTIRDGDLVIIKPEIMPVSGDVILIVGKWGDSFLRRYRQRGEEIFCSPDNSSYSPFKADSVLNIIGTVHSVWRNIRI